MKILQINSVCGIRSTGRIATELADKFISQGHECRIAYGREGVPERYKDISYRIGTDVQVMLNAMKARLFDNEGFNAVKQTRKFIEWANNYDPDILWLHNLHGYYINIDQLFDWIKSRPEMEVRWTIHDCWAFTGHCAHFSFVGCGRWKTGCHGCCQLKKYPSSFLYDNSTKNYIKKESAFVGVKNMTLIAPSHWLEGLIKQSFLKDYVVKVVHNTIDRDIFKPTEGAFREKNNLQDKKIVLGVASAWSEIKGLSDFIRLADMLDDSFAVVMVGLTPKQIKSMPDNILCVERTNSAQQLAQIYTAADVLLNLTYEDNYPTVNLEAQACGTPCITYRTGGSVESVPSENVIEQGNIAEIVSRIQDVCS